MKRARDTKPAREEIDNGDGLPEGWALACTVDLFTFVTSGSRGWAQYYAERGALFLRIANLNHDDITIDLSEKKYVKPPCSAEGTRTRVKIRDLLISITADVGMIGLVKNDLGEAYINQHIPLARPADGLDDQYLAWYLTSTHGQKQLEGLQRGATKVGLGLDDIQSINVPLAPIEEQGRIIAKIQSLLESVNASRDRLAKVPKILKAFRQSVFASACSGRLSEDWREKHGDVEPATKLLARIRTEHERHGSGHGGQAADPTEGVHTLQEEEFPDSWAIEELKWLCKPGRPITYGILKPGPDYPKGVPYIRVADFPGNQLDASGVRRTSPDIAHDYRRSILEPGDVLLSIRGTAGRVCRVPKELAGANITQDTARISILTEMSPKYIELYLKGPSVQKRLEGAMKGMAVRGVNIGDVRVLQVAVPPLEEQHEIVRRVKALFKLADKIEQRVEAATKRADKLTQAILAKSFRGELVPTEAELACKEGRDYEPASVLLERIKAEREHAAAGGNGIGPRRHPMGRKK